MFKFFVEWYDEEVQKWQLSYIPLSAVLHGLIIRQLSLKQRNDSNVGKYIYFIVPKSKIDSTVFDYIKEKGW